MKTTATKTDFFICINDKEKNAREWIYFENEADLTEGFKEYIKQFNLPNPSSEPTNHGCAPSYSQKTENEVISLTRMHPVANFKGCFPSYDSYRNSAASELSEPKQSSGFNDLPLNDLPKRSPPSP
ncbi:MAG: hypothetical protein U1E78_12475 [Gammaproteobacteria bacterium]